MKFTHEQISEIFLDILEEPDGFSTLIKIFIESLMKEERKLHNLKHDDYSNGFRGRHFYHLGKCLTLSVPRSRTHQFYPLILAVLKREDEDYKRFFASLYTRGLTGEEVGEVFEEIYGRHYSKSQIFNLTSNARQDVNLWLERRLDEFYPAVFIDVTYISTRRINNVSKEGFYTVLGLKEDTTREVLGIYNNPTESASEWTEIFIKLKERGVKQINLVVSDGVTGIEEAAKKVFPQSKTQLCTVHFKRNVLNEVKKCDKGEISTDLKAIFNTDNKSDTPISAHQRLLDFVGKWEVKYPVFKKYRKDRYHLYFTYYEYETNIRSMLYSTNWIERLHRDYKRVVKMRGALPSPESVLFLIGSAAMNMKIYDFKISAFKDSILLKK